MNYETVAKTNLDLNGVNESVNTAESDADSLAESPDK